MSLINDALKKAQKQRTGDGPELKTLPSIGGEPAARIAKRGKPPGFNSLLLWIGVGAATLGVVLVGGFFLVRWMTSAPPAPSPVKPASVAQVTSAAPEPASTAPSTTTPIISPPPPVASTPIPTAAPAVETKPVVVAPVQPPVEVPKPAGPALKMEPKAVAFIEALRVAGIRTSATDSKVLMNDRVYRTGDTIEHQLGLKLAVIAADALTFEDEHGARYTRNF